MRRMVFIPFLALPNVCFGITTWCRVYSPSSGNAIGYSGINVSPKSYVVAGHINDGNDAIILKLDSTGGIVSHRVYDFGYGFENFYKLRFFPGDNTFFALGMAGPTIGERYAVLMKIDTFLNTVWWVGERVSGSWYCCGTTYYADLFFDVTFSNVASPTSKVIAVGSSEHCDCNASEGKVSIYNFDGTPVFRGLYILPSSAAYPNTNFHTVLRITSNKFYAFGGDDWPYDTRIKILAFDTLGNIYWGRDIDAGEDFSPRGATLTPGGNIIVVGVVSPGDILITKIDTAVNVLWMYRIPLAGYDEVWEITSLPDGTYLVAGSTTSLGAGGYDGFLMKIDSLGNVLWFKTYGGSGNDGFHDVHYTPDGGVLLVGYSTSFSSSGGIWVVKADTGGNTCAMCAPISHTVSTSAISVSNGYTPVRRSYQFISSYSNPSVSLIANGCPPLKKRKKGKY